MSAPTILHPVDLLSASNALEFHFRARAGGSLLMILRPSNRDDRVLQLADVEWIGGSVAVCL